MGQDGDVSSLSDSIRRAAAAVKQSGVDAEFRIAAFECVLRDLLGTSPERAGGRASDSRPKPDANTRTSGDGFSEMARRLGMDEEPLSSYYRLEDGTVELIAPSQLLPGAKAEATRLVAVLVAAARHTVLGEREVDVGHVREACEYYGVYDQPNFMRALQDGVSLMVVVGRKGSRSRSIRLHRQGWEAARDVLTSYDLVGNGGMETDRG